MFVQIVNARRRVKVPADGAWFPSGNIIGMISTSVSDSDNTHGRWLTPTDATCPKTGLLWRPRTLVDAPNRHGVQEVASSNLAAPIAGKPAEMQAFVHLETFAAEPLLPKLSRLLWGSLWTLPCDTSVTHADPLGYLVRQPVPRCRLHHL